MTIRTGTCLKMAITWHFLPRTPNIRHGRKNPLAWLGSLFHPSGSPPIAVGCTRCAKPPLASGYANRGWRDVSIGALNGDGNLPLHGESYSLPYTPMASYIWMASSHEKRSQVIIASPFLGGGKGKPVVCVHICIFITCLRQFLPG